VLDVLGLLGVLVATLCKVWERKKRSPWSFHWHAARGNNTSVRHADRSIKCDLRRCVDLGKMTCTFQPLI
jgi:hypothetical protein